MSQRSKLSRNCKTKLQDSQNSKEIESLCINYVNDIVRYILCKMGTKVPFKKQDILQHVCIEKPGKNFAKYMDEAAKILENTYGLKLEIIDGKSGRKYFVSNGLPIAIDQDSETNNEIMVTFLVLSHIFMSKNCSTDVALWQFLNEALHLDCASAELDGVGNVKTFVMKTLTKQQYVHFESRGGEHDDGELKKRFSWGLHADEVVSKLEILKFISKIYDGENLESWGAQYKEALTQFQNCDLQTQSQS